MILIEDVQDGMRPYRTWKALLTRFLVNDSGKYYSQEQAARVIGGLNMEQLNEAIDAFTGALRRKAIPPKKSDT